MNVRKIFQNILVNSQVLIFILSGFFLTYRLGEMMFSVDTPFWYQRTENFIKAIKAGDWASTFQNPKPGVTIMWLSGLGLEAFMTLYQNIFHFRPFIYTYDTYKYVDMSVTLPLIGITLISQLFFYRIVRDMFGKVYSLFALTLFVFEPLYIGISRIFHGDGALTAFMTMSGISLIYAVYRNYSLKLFAASGTLAALAMLSKSQAIFLILYAVLIIALEALINFRQKELWRKLSKCLAVWAICYVVTFFVVFPAMWVKPADTVKAIANEMLYMGAGDRTDVPEEYIQDHYRYFKTIGKVFSPANILLFPIGLVLLIQQLIKGGIYNTKDKLKMYGLLFCVFYFLQMTLSIQKAERYLLPLYPFVGLISAQAIHFFWVKGRLYRLATIPVLAVVMYHLIINTPHYTAHAEYGRSWGALTGEAASYLNKKGGATELKVSVHPRKQMFRPFFKGKTYASDETLPNGWHTDYLVVDAMYEFPTKFLDICQREPEKEIVFNGKVYWTIHKCYAEDNE